MKKMLKIPKFKNEKQERAFFDKIDFSDYFEAKDFEKVSFPNLKPSSHPVSIRLPDSMYCALREKANLLNIPYQSLIKTYLSERLAI